MCFRQIQRFRVGLPIKRVVPVVVYESSAVISYGIAVRL